MCLDNYALNCVEVTSSAEQMPANARLQNNNFYVIFYWSVCDRSWALVLLNAALNALIIIDA